VAVFVSFPLARAAAAVAAADFTAAAARPHSIPPPFFGGGKYQKKEIACSVGDGVWTCLRRRGLGGGGVCRKLAAVCGSVKLCELSLKGTQSLAVKPKTAWFLFFLLTFSSS
jgi:hypothetical protein